MLRSSYVAKLVLFAALVTSCHLTLHVIDSSPRVSAHFEHHVTVTSLIDLDSDVRAAYRRQYDVTMTSFNEFVVNSLSHLSIMVQLINNGNYFIW